MAARFIKQFVAESSDKKPIGAAAIIFGELVDGTIQPVSQRTQGTANDRKGFLAPGEPCDTIYAFRISAG
jgi:hypothetical protein